MLMETVMVMPILLLLIFGIIQFALIWTARQMVSYAAFCATRATMVVPGGEKDRAAQDAAEIALSWINVADSEADPVQVPGWGGVTGSGHSDNGGSRVEATVVGDGDGEKSAVAAVKVTFYYPLMIPGMAVNKIIASAANAVSSVTPSGDFYADLDAAAGNPGEIIDGWPHVKLTETCVLPMPYSTARFPTGAFEGLDIREGEDGK